MSGYYDTLKIKPDACPADCQVCVDACAGRGNENNLGAVIKIVGDVKDRHSAASCYQCSKPECLEACPSDAITKSAEDGVVRIDMDECTGCEACVDACPYEMMVFNDDKQIATKCDMCDGKAVCAEACPHGIISVAKAAPVRKYLQEDLLSPGVAFCAGCGLELALRHTLKVLGKDIVIFASASCSAPVLIGTGHVSLEKTAFYGCLMTNIASSAAGYARYYRRIGKEVTPVCFVGDGNTVDIGFQNLSGAAERGENILYICYDNEGYMNTGYQKSSTTPRGAWTSTTEVGSTGRGKPSQSKDVALMMAMHDTPYVATATLSNLEDYASKLIKAKEAIKHGLAYIHLYSPCPTGWKLAPDSTVEMCRNVVESNTFPLWEAEYGDIRFTYQPKEQKPVASFIKMARKFSHLTDEDIQALQDNVDHRYARLQKLAGVC